MTFDAYPNVLLALCLWREARGCDRAGKVAVKHVILNRAAHPTGPFAACPDVVTNILAPRQFTSFSTGDANAAKLPDPKHAGDWTAWRECCAVVDEDQPDPTGGANYYFAVSIAPPAWADPAKETVQIGPHRFFHL